MKDQALARAAKAGDRPSLGALLEPHLWPMRRLALAITGRPADAEDVVQSAAALAVERIGQLRDDAAFAAWFRRIVINQARTVVRRRRRHEVPVDIDDVAHVLPAPAQDVDRVLDLNDAVNLLAPRHRKVYTLHFAEGLTTRDVAARLGRAEGTVRRQVSEIRTSLRHVLEDGGIEFDAPPTER